MHKMVVHEGAREGEGGEQKGREGVGWGEEGNWTKAAHSGDAHSPEQSQQLGAWSQRDGSGGWGWVGSVVEEGVVLERTLERDDGAI